MQISFYLPKFELPATPIFAFMKSLGIDIGSSSVKVSLMDIETGACVASATQPAQEMPIEARHSG